MKPETEDLDKVVAQEDLNSEQHGMKSQSCKENSSEEKNFEGRTDANNISIDEMMEMFANYSYFFVLPS